MNRKFKHYATDEIREFNVSNNTIDIEGNKHRIVPCKDSVRAEGTSWILMKNEI